MATAPTSGGRLSAKEFQSMFETSDIVHVSAHGSYIYSSPWESYFRLQEPYRVVDLTRVRSRSGLVVFGACHTGESTTGGGNDSIGFAHAVLQSGALSFVGGLWALDDRISMLLMHVFYKRLRQASQQGSGACIAECWQKSVKELYHLDQRSERTLLEEIEAIWATARENGIRPEGGEFKFSRGKLRIAQQEVKSQALDFSHPYYWAALSLVGYGSLIFKASSGADMKATKTGLPLPTTTQNSGTSCSTVPVTFDHIVTTVVGQTVKVVGSIPALGSWNPSTAPALSASKYTSTNQLWTTTLNLPAGQSFHYKFVIVESNGTVKWESYPNRSYFVPSSCQNAAVSGTWRP